MSYYPDISHYHPVEDWSEVRAGCPFLISKATQGTGYIDTTLSEFIQGCEANQIPYWLYAYLNRGDELAQAEFLVNTCKDRVRSYFQGYVLDVEAGNAAADVQAALDYLEGLGGRCIIYTMYAQYSTYKSVIDGRSVDTAWWEARYGKNDGSYSSSYPAHDGADLHQYTSKGSCPGISGQVCDLNRLTGTRAESWFTGGTAPAAATDTATTGGFDVSTLSTIRQGSAGAQVKSLQSLLNGKGDAGLSVDGDCGSKTVAAIRRYQRDQGLTVDGIAGVHTWTALLTR
ncbi:MAG: peptidoglycan-binding protein [Clostridiales bacterium]|nr:peptidoglycan-binding protein [Clostridiales bacterium]